MNRQATFEIRIQGQPQSESLHPSALNVDEWHSMLKRGRKLVAQAEVRGGGCLLCRGGNMLSSMNFLTSEKKLTCKLLDIRTPPQEFLGTLF